MTLGPRVLILGCSGSGKSTLARQLLTLTHTPVIHLDQLFWQDGWVECERAEFERKLQLELQKDSWIIDGNYDHTLPMRLARATDVLVFDFSRWLCLYRVFKRIVFTYGEVRPDMPTGCPERFNLSFIQWVWNFRRDIWPATSQVLDEHSDRVRIHLFKNPQSVDRFLGLSPD